MSKLKRLIPAALSVIFAFAIFTASACKVEPGAVDKNALISIEIDTYYVQTSFELGEKFTSENLEVTATLRNIETDEYTYPDVSNAVKVDSSNYNANKVGTYDIHVSYTHAGVTRTASYEVDVTEVEPGFGGITVEYVADFDNKVTLSYQNNRATIPQDKLIVKKVDENGVVSDTALPASDYTVDLYLGNEKLSSWTVDGGAYTLLVTLNSDKRITNFVNYYVVDKLNSFSWDKDAAGTITEIDQWSSDYYVQQMAATWKFKAIYDSGNEKTITVANEGVSFEYDVETAGSKSITVKYVDIDALGETSNDVASVKITVNEIDADIHEYKYNFTELQDKMKAVLGVGTVGDNTALKAEYFNTEKNSFLTFVTEGSSSNDQYRTASGGCIEIKGGRLQVTFQGKGWVEVAFSSTGGSNVSGLVLTDSKGNYIYGTATAPAVALTEDDMNGNLKGLFIVEGSNAGKVKFSVEEAGTYTIYSWYDYGGKSRGCRLSSIAMKDVVIK